LDQLFQLLVQGVKGLFAGESGDRFLDGAEATGDMGNLVGDPEERGLPNK
jgi:hypothetical protein